jgi:hypothetical protein
MRVEITKLLTVVIPREHLDRASAAFDGVRSYDKEFFALLEEQRHIYGLMSEGVREDLGLKVASDSGHFPDGRFLNMHFFATHIMPDISSMLKGF